MTVGGVDNSTQTYTHTHIHSYPCIPFIPTQCHLLLCSDIKNGITINEELVYKVYFMAYLLFALNCGPYLAKTNGNGTITTFKPAKRAAAPVVVSLFAI
jgi:hypothetical protein